MEVRGSLCADTSTGVNRRFISPAMSFRDFPCGGRKLIVVAKLSSPTVQRSSCTAPPAALKSSSSASRWPLGLNISKRLRSFLRKSPFNSKCDVHTWLRSRGSDPGSMAQKTCLPRRLRLRTAGTKSTSPEIMQSVGRNRGIYPFRSPFSYASWLTTFLTNDCLVTIWVHSLGQLLMGSRQRN
jgi:hypothetical protein